MWKNWLKLSNKSDSLAAGTFEYRKMGDIIFRKIDDIIKRYIKNKKYLNI